SAFLACDGLWKGERMNPIRVSLFIAALCIFSVSAFAQARPYPGPDLRQIYDRLLPQIEKIPAFDHHAHPGFADDPDVDAMAAPPGSVPFRERDTNPELIAVANRAMMADYLDAKRFPWVFFADAFMWPFDNRQQRSRNPDEEVYIPLQE